MLITIGVVALYWILESVVMVLVFQQGNLVEQMFSSDPHEIWMRSLAMGISIVFGVYAQFLMSKRKRAEHDLQERIKELQCLYGIAEVAERPDITSDELYQEVVNLLPSSWQYPEITCARTIIDNKEFKTKNCRDTEWKQSSDIKVFGAKAGTVEVGYLERPEIDEEPFLKEEKLLIDAVAERLGDITERKRMEEKIQQQNKFLSNILNSLTHPFYVVDANDYTIKMANPAAKMGNLSENATCHALTHKSSKPCGDIDHVCPLEEVKKTKKPVVVEHIHYDEDGNARNIEVHGYPIFDSEGNVIQMIEYCLDIAERKRAEEELRKTYQELRDTHVQLLQAGKMASMGEMAAGIAHELTQPLLGIKGFATAMLEDMKPYLPTETSAVSDIPPEMERAVKDIEVILQQTDRMTIIVNNVRQFARESGTEMALLDINKPVEDALMLFSEQLRVHNIVIEKNLVAGLPRVTGNANQLQQVFINLITNARDAMDAKGEKGQLTISTGVCPGGVYVEVEDTGSGADAETLSKMFLPFFTTKTNGKSTGLGLSIVTGIIEEHSGTIDVQSEPGRGCKFTITLPLGAREEGD